MTRERALEIIAGHGGDASRWPVDEGIAVLALAARDADVATAIADARRLDGLLAGWAAPVPERRFDVDALLAAVPGAVVMVPARPGAVVMVPVRPGAVAMVPARPAVRGWLAGGALAAAVAGALLLMPGARQPSLPAGAAGQPSAAAAGPSTGLAADASAPATAPPAATMMIADAGPAPAAAMATARVAATIGAAIGSDAELFATVFTPTIYEDELI